MTKEKIQIGMKPPHPGQFVREEILEELGLSIAGAAKHLGVRNATLSDLLNEKAGLSPEMALRIELAFSVNADMLMRMQVWLWHDIAKARSRAADLKVAPYKTALEDRDHS
ncbi:MAG: HigA family addiction module antitoxin [Rhodomicrobiaceae bacterium]